MPPPARASLSIYNSNTRLGAVCTWSLFGKDHNPLIPDFVLDHPVGLMCVRCHPANPSLIAAGSFNGEVIVWDVNSPETPVQVSPITEESHEDPVMNVDWVYDSALATYLVSSLGADGKVNFKGARILNRAHFLLAFPFLPSPSPLVML
jgi:WD40 repeat protein